MIYSSLLNWIVALVVMTLQVLMAVVAVVQVQVVGADIIMALLK
jgi:hypothetical protein